MIVTEAKVLSTLAPGGQLTADQIARAAGISVRRAKRTATSLARRGLAFGRVGSHRDAWCLAPAGAVYVATRRGQSVLDLPERTSK